jgi:hypothetical protein
MKYFANTREIDGYTVITGFKSPPVDPVQTSRIVDTVIEETTEYKVMKKITDHYSDLERRRTALIREARQKNSSKEHEAVHRNYVETVAKQRAMQAEIVKYNPHIKSKRKQLYREHAAYFMPSGYEEIDGQAFDSLQKKFSELRPKQYLTIEGNIMTNKRGEKYWLKDEFGWTEFTVCELGEEIPTGAIHKDKLSNADIADIILQKEAERISKLTTEQKQHEKDEKMKRLLSFAAGKRSEYEISGVNPENSLALSQKWYRDEASKLETLYG